MVIRGTKRTQHCTFCKNHGLSEPKKGHQCPYANCPCLLCKLTKKAQVAMRHQQRVWRHQKQKLKIQGIEEDTPSGEKASKGQACDKCRNHNIIKPKRNHECPYQDCDCEYCSLTFKRREIMKHQQRVRRSKIMSQVESGGREPTTEDGNGPKDEDEEGTGNDTDNNSKDSSYDKEFDDPSSDCMETREELPSPSSPAELIPLPRVNSPNELESLSARFSSLEADYPIQMVPDLEPIGDESNSDLGATGCDMSVPSPPPLLPLDSDKPYSSEDFRNRNQAFSHSAPYGIPHSDQISLESYNDPYRDPSHYPQGFQMVESSQISTFLLLQRERYLSEQNVRYYPTPRQSQQPSSALKLTMDQSYINRTIDISLPATDNRLNQSAIAASFSNITQTPTMTLQHESQHPQQIEQLRRQHQRHQYRLQQQRNLDQSCSLPYFHQSHRHS